MKETLEEAAEMYIQSKNPQWTPYHKRSFKDGAEWQAENSNINALHFEIDALKREIEILKHQPERMYSEEEVIEITKQYAKRCQAPIQSTEWLLEQFKKK
jgi:hypothetical protein